MPATAGNVITDISVLDTDLSVLGTAAAQAETNPNVDLIGPMMSVASDLGALTTDVISAVQQTPVGKALSIIIPAAAVAAAVKSTISDYATLETDKANGVNTTADYVKFGPLAGGVLLNAHLQPSQVLLLPSLLALVASLAVFVLCSSEASARAALKPAGL